jgi:hypothetical protein
MQKRRSEGSRAKGPRILMPPKGQNNSTRGWTHGEHFAGLNKRSFKKKLKNNMIKNECDRCEH